jgi:hypothetical protein
MSLVLLAGMFVGAGVCAMPGAGAVGQVWNGKYSLLRYAGEKTGTSLAARQPEPDFSDVYTFVTDCTGGRRRGPGPEREVLAAAIRGREDGHQPGRAPARAGFQRRLQLCHRLLQRHLCRHSGRRPQASQPDPPAATALHMERFDVGAHL